MKRNGRFPGIDALKPGEQLLVISDEGAVYRGAHAWIMCLWALENYREHAQRLAHPALLSARKTRLRIALSKPLLLIRCFIPTGT